MTRLYTLACWIVLIGFASENLAAYIAWVVWTLLGLPREAGPGTAW